MEHNEKNCKELAKFVLETMDWKDLNRFAKTSLIELFLKDKDQFDKYYKEYMEPCL